MAVVLRLATKARNPFLKEIQGAADALDISYNTALIINFSYETNSIAYWSYRLWDNHAVPVGSKLKELYQKHIKNSIACTAGVMNSPDLGMLHVRTLDWPLKVMGRHTLILHHINVPAGDFYSVGWAGYSGVLSGFKPGKFSATINQAFIKMQTRCR